MRNLIAQKPNPDPLAHVAKPAPPNPVMELIERCVNSTGFFLCISHISGEKDGAGNNIIHHHRIRHNFMNGDVDVALEAWQELIEKDRPKLRRK